MYRLVEFSTFRIPLLRKTSIPSVKKSICSQIFNLSGLTNPGKAKDTDEISFPGSW